MEKATYIEQLQWGVDYIEDHLDQEIQLEQVARAAGLSRWHYQRIFAALTGETLATYIRARRMSLARDRLTSTNTRIIDIAILSGFQSHEAFTRAFKKAFGMTPSAYRRQDSTVTFLDKIQFDREYLRHVADANLTSEPRIENRDAMVLIGSATHFFGVGSDRNNVGDKIPPLWNSFLARESEVEHFVPSVGYGLLSQQRPDSEQLLYQAAWQVSKVESIPTGMVRIDLPPTTYAIFTHRGWVDQLDHTVNYAYSTWLTQSGRRHAGGPDIEIFGPAYDPHSAESIVEYAIPIS